MRRPAAALLVLGLGAPGFSASAAEAPAPASVARMPPAEWSPGVILRELVGRELPASRHSEALSVTQLEMEAGQSTPPLRSRSAEQVVLVNAGRGQIRLGERSLPLRTGDFLRIPADTACSLQAAADSTFTVYVISAPAWQAADQAPAR